MGLSWQQGPLGRNPTGTFLTATPMPERVLYMEPLRRRMSVQLGGSIIVQSDEVVILFEPARYPVAYFPIGDIDQGVLQPSDYESTHPDLGKTKWFNVVGGDGVGWLMRKSGLTCDNLRAADLFTADGQFVSSARANRDRGGDSDDRGPPSARSQLKRDPHAS